MRFHILMLVVAVALLTAANVGHAGAIPSVGMAPTRQQRVPLPTDSVRRVTVEDIKAAAAQNQVFFIDVRGDKQYTADHIPGAINIPAGFIMQQMSKVPQGKFIVAYCT